MFWTVALLLVLAGLIVAVILLGLAIIGLADRLDARRGLRHRARVGPLDVSGAVAGATHYDPGPATPLDHGAYLAGKMTVRDPDYFRAYPDYYGRRELTLEEELELLTRDEDVGGA